MEITMTEALAIAERVDSCDDNIAVRANYSGRGMYGKGCLAFTGNFSQVALGCAMRVVLDDAADELGDEACVDNMGLDIVVYFPHVTVTGEGDPVELCEDCGSSLDVDFRDDPERDMCDSCYEDWLGESAANGTALSVV